MKLEKLQNQPLKALYIFNNQEEVVKYLNEKINLISFLLEAYPKIREVFASAKLVLRVSFDPEIIGYKKLIIAIHTNLEADEAFNRLKLLDNNLWLEAASEIGNDLEIIIEFDEV